MTSWITDENGNRASVAEWGSEDAARASLSTLKDCSRCLNCSRCSDCSDCSRCSNCSDLSDQKNTSPAANAGPPPTPRIDNIDAAIYAAVRAPGALDMSSWHTCETTHCRAGWAVHLAGEPGRALESFYNTELAAMLIYRESGSPINPCRFHDSDTAALADMKARAEEAL